MNKNSATTFVRPAAIVLIFRLLLIEIIILTIFSMLKVPQIIFFNEFGALIQIANLVSWLTLIISSIVQLTLVTTVVLSWANEYYIIRNSKIIHRFGVFQIKEEQYSLENIESLTLEQFWYQRIFNYGTIHFFSPVLKQEYYLSNISSPKEIRDIIDTMLDTKNQNTSQEKIIFRN